MTQRAAAWQHVMRGDAPLAEHLLPRARAPPASRGAPAPAAQSPQPSALLHAAAAAARSRAMCARGSCAGVLQPAFFLCVMLYVPCVWRRGRSVQWSSAAVPQHRAGRTLRVRRHTHHWTIDWLWEAHAGAAILFGCCVGGAGAWSARTGHCMSRGGARAIVLVGAGGAPASHHTAVCRVGLCGRGHLLPLCIETNTVRHAVFRSCGQLGRLVTTAAAEAMQGQRQDQCTSRPPSRQLMTLQLATGLSTQPPDAPARRHSLSSPPPSRPLPRAQTRQHTAAVAPYGAEGLCDR